MATRKKTTKKKQVDIINLKKAKKPDIITYSEKTPEGHTIENEVVIRETVLVYRGDIAEIKRNNFITKNGTDLLEAKKVIVLCPGRGWPHHIMEWKGLAQNREKLKARLRNTKQINTQK